MARVWILGCLLSLGLAGCVSSYEYFPLEVGRKWTFNVRSEMATFVEDVKVVGRVPVGDVNGYKLDGPLGMTRLAWRKGRLISDCLPNTRLSRPITLFAPGVAEKIPWSGEVEILGKSFPAKAVLVQEKETWGKGTRKRETIKATLTVDLEDRRIELITWYAQDMGPLRQEQRTNGKQDYSLEYLAHS